MRGKSEQACTVGSHRTGISANPGHRGMKCRALGLALCLGGSLMAGCGVDEASREDHVSRQTVLDDSLKAGFLTPPPEARPRVWWHWMNGNVTREGIGKDLEWMHRVGIGGVQNFDAAMATPVIVDERLVYMSDEWKDAFRFAVSKADELGLEFAIAASPGWSETGGPWVPPEDGMKKLVWSETRVRGGQTFTGPLPQPSDVTGPYHDLGAVHKHAHNEAAVPTRLYRDVAVIAYPAGRFSETRPQMAINGTTVDADSLLDDDLGTGIALPPHSPEAPPVIDITYSQPQTIRSAVVHVANLPPAFLGGVLKPRLEARDENGEWRHVTDFHLTTVPTTLSFPAVTAQHFRLLLAREQQQGGGAHFAPAPGVDSSGLGGISAMAAAGRTSELTALKLLAEPRVSQFEVKAGFALVDDYHALESVAEEEPAVDPSEVVELTGQMNEAGELAWAVPPGEWKVLRLGYSLTGKTNSPATAEATGLEVDKYDAEAVERYLRTYLGMYRDVLGDGLVGQKGLRALLTDSTEVGPSNWTPRLREKFVELRGYDPTPWLPALTGEIVGSREQSDAFLYDFRRTLAELSVTEHYATVAKVAHDNGLVVYGESLEGNRLVSTLGDDLEMRRFADIPMAAMWTFGGRSPAPHYIADMRGAASVAHLYGRKYVAAESLTSIMHPWAHAPADLQPMIDAEFVNGINRPVIHTSVHQPVDDKVPGLSLHVFGQFFTRHETWAEMARPWVDYLARNSYLLQQGRNVAEVAYFYGEEPPIGVLAQKAYPTDVPRRYAYDFVPPHAVLDALSVDGGDLVTEGGARYRVLYLGESSRSHMTLPVLKRLAHLVKEGATLVGRAPVSSPSLGDDATAFASLVADLWSGEDTTFFGQGRVIDSDDVEAVLTGIGIAPAFETDVAEAVQFVHRYIEDGHIYYVVNTGDAVVLEARFRVVGKAPEVWHADSGSIEPASYRIEGEQTIVPLHLEARQSLFVVFREDAQQPARSVTRPAYSAMVDIVGPWRVDFQENRGAPQHIELDRLVSLSEHNDPGVRYFSGVASYSTTFEVPAGQGVQPLVLDLGVVGDVAEVLVNGQSAGIAWKPPYRVDIGALVNEGMNTLAIRVANLWVNRLIGDARGEGENVAYTTFNTYLPDAPLRPSGLLGPVRLLGQNSTDRG